VKIDEELTRFESEIHALVEQTQQPKFKHIRLQVLADVFEFLNQINQVRELEGITQMKAFIPLMLEWKSYQESTLNEYTHSVISRKGSV
jgi:hypothetical protein